MKRRSKLFLAAAAIIFGAGLVICLAGYLVAHLGGEQLFAEKLDGGRGYEYEFKNESLDILKLNVQDADINIIGGSEKSGIEILNFNESLYTLENSASMVSFRQSADPASDNFWEGGFSFKGLRYFLNPGTGKSRGTVNVYLGKNQYIRVYDITARGGSINISGINTESDYQLKPGGVKVSMSNISAASTVNITANDGTAPEVILDNVSAESVTVAAATAKLSCGELTALSCDINVSGGSIDVEYTPPEGKGDFAAKVSTKGRLTVNGEDYTDFFSYPAADPDSEGGDGKDDENSISPHISVNTAISGSDAAVDLKIPASLPTDDGEE